MSAGTSTGLEKDNRLLRLKTMCVVREVYRREDIPCQSALCLNECQPDADANCLLPDNVGTTHYVLPDPRVAREYLEILEDPHISGIIFTQTAVHSVQHDGSRRLHNRLKAIVKDRRRRSVIFHNEFQKYAHCDRLTGEPMKKWHTRATYQSTDWYYNHLAGAMPVVMLTSDEEFIREYGNKTVNVFILTMETYLKTFWEAVIPGVMDVYQSITDSLSTKTRASDYVGYLPLDVVTAGIKAGKYVQGYLQVNKSNASQEAFVRRARVDMKAESGSDILIAGSAARNRGIHGDLVAVEILPKAEWRGRSLVIRDTSTQETSQSKTTEDDEHKDDDTTDVMPTGRVIAVMQRNWREYVACFSQDEV